MKLLKFMPISTVALCCLSMTGYAAVITLDEGDTPTSRALVPANTVPGDVILCESALNQQGTDCVSLADRSDIIFINTRNFGGTINADLYSDFGQGEDFADRTRINVNVAFPDPLNPTLPLVNTIALLESTGRVTYSPSPGQAGYFPGNSYVFISDSNVPEPGSLGLFGFGGALLLAGLVRKRSMTQ
jgi:hypothetical protein